VVVVVIAALTVTLWTDETEAANPALPAYAAKRPYVPTGRLLVVNVATPEELTVPVPNTVTPFLKVTKPAGVPVGAGVTVAVKVTSCPAVAGFGTTVKVVVVTVSALTVTLCAVEVAPANPVLPENTAVRLNIPFGRLLVVNVAIPKELTLPLPNNVAPSKKFTVPRVVPVGAGVTVAVKVTDCPENAGFGATFKVIVVTVWALTVTITADEVEVANPALPEKTAVMLDGPRGRLLVVNVATPEELISAIPSDVAPLKKSTLSAPVGIGATVAVHVTSWPEKAGFGEQLSEVVVATGPTGMVTDWLAARMVSPG
jgi:hypothetical protein